MKLIGPAILLLGSFAAVFLWRELGFSSYSIPAVGVLIFLFILLSSRRNKKPSIAFDSPITIFALNTTLLLLIAETGGLNSPLFFLLYFILFGIAFVFQSNLAFVFAGGAFVYFITEALSGDLFLNLIKLGSLLFLSPLAYFVGNQNRREEKNVEEVEAMKERTKDSADTISKDIETVLEDPEAKLTSGDVEKLNEVLEEAEDLRTEKKENA